MTKSPKNAISNQTIQRREGVKELRMPAQHVPVAMNLTGSFTHQKGCFPQTRSAIRLRGIVWRILRRRIRGHDRAVGCRHDRVHPADSGHALYNRRKEPTKMPKGVQTYHRSSHEEDLREAMLPT